MSTLSDLESAVEKIKAGKVPPLVLVYGDQDYLVKQAYDRLLMTLVPEDLRGFNLEQLDGSKVEAQAVVDAFDIVPMMPGPKALGVMDARFFQSKINGLDLLKRAAEAWERKDVNACLRSLGRTLALVGWNWEDAQGRDLKAFAQALEADAPEGKAEWLEKALAQGLASSFPLPSAADESGEILLGLERSLEGTAEGQPRMLVFSAPGADGRKKLYKFIQEKGLVLEFKNQKQGPQASQTAAAFLRTILAQRGLKMPFQLSNQLVSSYGFSLGILQNEVAKLEAYAHPRKEIGESDLGEVGSPPEEDNIFKLFELLGKRQQGLKEALPLLHSLLEREPAQKIFSQVANEARLLYLCRCLLDEGKVPSRGLGEYFSYKSQVHPKLGTDLPSGLAAQFRRTSPFPAFLAFQRCRQFEPAALKAALEAILAAEWRMRTSRSDIAAELEILCVNLCGIRETTVV